MNGFSQSSVPSSATGSDSRDALAREADGRGESSRAFPVSGVPPAAVAPGQSVIIIDSRALVRECLARCLQTASSDQCVLAFSCIADWQAVAASYPAASLVVLRAQPDSRGEIERILTELRDIAPDLGSIVISDEEDVDSILLALKHGARGYIPTSVSFAVAVEAMRLVQAGGSFVPASSLVSLHPGASTPPPDLASLTTRQAQIVSALQHGKANKQIAYELNMCESTVKVHIRQIMKKLNARNRTEIAVLTNHGGMEKAAAR